MPHSKAEVAAELVRLLRLFCALYGLLRIAMATTVVVIRTPAEVIIAADSAETIQLNGRPAQTLTVCKIYQLESKLFFAVSGLVHDALTAFNIPEIVAAASHKGGSLAEKLARAERDVQTALLHELPQVKERDPTGYAKLTDAKGAVTIMFAGIEAGVPTATSFSLGLANSPKGSIETTTIRDSCPGNCPSGVRAFWFGEGAEIERLRAHGGLPPFSMPELAQFLVQSEIDARAPGVGGPVDVLRILPSGPVWLQRKQSCPVAIMRRQK